jgi:hypothetical protein
MHHQGFAGRLLELEVGSEDHRGGAHPLMGEIDAGWGDPLLGQRLGGANEPVPRHDDPVVGRYEILLRPVDDGSHAFLQRCILHGDAFDAAIGVPAQLGGAVAAWMPLPCCIASRSACVRLRTGWKS